VLDVATAAGGIGEGKSNGAALTSMLFGLLGEAIPWGMTTVIAKPITLFFDLRAEVAKL
jgi:hypothetical protein